MKTYVTQNKVEMGVIDEDEIVRGGKRGGSGVMRGGIGRGGGLGTNGEDEGSVGVESAKVCG